MAVECLQIGMHREWRIEHAEAGACCQERRASGEGLCRFCGHRRVAQRMPCSNPQHEAMADNLHRCLSADRRPAVPTAAGRLPRTAERSTRTDECGRTAGAFLASTAAVWGAFKAA